MSEMPVTAAGSGDVLDALPRVALALSPTPLHPLERLREALGGAD